MSIDATARNRASAQCRAAGTRILLPLALLAAASLPCVASAEEGTRDGSAHREAKPHPRLAVLPDNTALDLGRYECEQRAPDSHCVTIFDFSRINYDPVSGRMLLFGGGHAATGRTDVDTFDMAKLRWESLYPSMSCKEIAEQDIDPRGFHRKTGHPVARHTYDQNVIVEAGGRVSLMMFSTEGFRGYCHGYRTHIRGVAWLPLDDASRTWQYSQERRMPWGYAGTAEFDPVSGMVVLTGGQSHGMWIYDPVAHEVVASIRLARPSNHSNLLYFPPNRKMYLFDSESGDVREFDLNRNDWRASTVTTLDTTGDKPGAMRNFAYDTKNKIIGGMKGGRFYAFDPETRRWHSEAVRSVSDDDSKIGRVTHHAIDYDRVNNVFVFVTDKQSGRRTWAYRYRR